MSQAIIRHQSPEEREYARYLTEIEARKRRVAELQADLAEYKEALGRFNAEYHARVGVLFVELDRINLAIKEYEFRIAQLRANPELASEDLENQTKQEFTEEREQIHEDEEETRYYEQEHRQEQRRPELDEASELSLKSLYRELAKRFHPDLAKTDEERIQRETVMREVNAAFHERNLHQLRTIEAQHDVDETAFEEKSIGEKLVWAIREMSRLDELIAAIQRERVELESSEVAQMCVREQSGEDVFGSLTRRLSLMIDAAHSRYQATIQEYRQVLEDQQ